MSNANTVYLYSGNTLINTYTTTQAAISAASAFDTIKIGAGTYDENVNVNINGLTIENMPGAQVTILGQGGAYGGALTIASGVFGVTIKSSDGIPGNFVVEGATSGGQTAALYLVGDDDNIKINGITTIAPTSGVAGLNSVLTGGNLNNVLFVNNVFNGNADQLVYVNGAEEIGPSAQNGNVNFVGNIFAGSAPGGLLGMSAPGEVINNKFTGSGPIAIGLNESGVNVSGNTFTSLPTQAYFVGDGSYDPQTIENNNSFPQQDEIYIIQNGVRQDGVYTSIQAAINAAIPGDTVFVGNGTYNQNVALADGVNIEGQSRAGVIINGTVSTPSNFDNTTISNLTVYDNSSTAMLLDMTGTQEVTSSEFSNVTFNLNSSSTAAVLIGNGQVAGSMALQGNGLTFSNVTMNSNDNNFAKSTAFAYTLFHSVNGAQLVLDGVNLNGTASGSSTGLGAQWNMSPNPGETADVTIENSATSGGGNFYVSGMASATITNNIFNGQGLALNGVENATVTGNTFENIDGSITSNDTQHRGLTIENAWGTTGNSNITVENNVFQNIAVSDGAIAFQRWTDNSGNLIPATISQLNDIDIQGNTFTNVNNSVYLNPASFNSSTVIPISFEGQQLIVGTSGADTINDTSTGPMTIIGGGGVDTINGGSGNTTYYVSAGDTLTDSGGTDEVRTDGSFTLPANIENLTLLDGDSSTQTFDNMPLGAIANGENGWEVLTPGEDEGIVAGPDGSDEFKMSSDPGNTAFGGPYSPGLSVAAGEPDAGALFSGETISYNFQAIDSTPDGSRLEVDFGNAAGTDRNNFLVIESAPTGIRIAVSEPDVNGNFDGDSTDPSPDDWRQLISGIDPTVQHTLTMQLTYVDGSNNDVINIYLDGQFIGSTTTFENYRDSLGGTHAANAAANMTDRIFFRPSPNGAPQDGPSGQNQGFYFDNITNSVYNNSNGTGNSLDNVISGNDGTNVLTGLGGNDTLIGGGGVDTANYLGTLTTSDFSYDNVNARWIVNATNDGQNEGTDTLSQMEIVTDGAGHAFRLVGDGSQYQTIQEAIDAAQAGDTILVAPGIYDEHLSINKSITIEGANFGVSGTGTRGVETDIVGGITITADNVTVDGVQVSGSYDSVTQNGTDLPNGVVIESNNVTIENSVFTGEGAAVNSRPFSTFGGINGFSFTNNAVTGWQEGAYIVNGGTGTISHDTFTNDGSAVVTESIGMTISNDSFQHSGTPSYGIGSDIATDGNQSNVDLDTFVGPNDTFSAGDTKQLSVYLNAAGPVTVTNDTGINATIHGEYATGPLTYFGGAASDAITGTSLNDTFNVGAGNDSIDGGSGTNTVKYDAAVSTTDFSVVGGKWQVSDGTHGTDGLNNVEKVTDGTHNFLLVGAGGYATIQAAVNAASAGDTILIAPGTYAGATISEALTIIGSGSGSTLVNTSDATNGFDLTGDINSTVVGDSATVSISGIGFIDNQDGIDVHSSTNLANLTINNDDFETNVISGVGMGSGAPNLANISITNSTFTQNGNGSENGDGDISLFGFLGNATLQNLIVNGGTNMTPTTSNADYGIQISGFDPTTHNVTQAIGDVDFDNVEVNGSYEKVSVYVQGYTDLNGLDFENSGNGGTVISGHDGWGYGLYLDPTSGMAPSVTIPLNGNHLFLTASAVAESVNLADVSVTNNIVSFAGVPLGTVFNGTPENDTISGLSGGDNYINGAGGIDTVNFTETLTASDFELSSGNWITTTATEGSDILQGVEVVKDGGGHTFLLVGGGSTYTTPDQAFTSAQYSSGDIIIDTLAQDEVPTLSFNGALVGQTGAGTVSYTVGSLDDDARGTVTFTDPNGRTVQASVTSNGTFSVNLSSLADGTINASLSVTDSAGNAQTVASGNSLTLDQDLAEHPSVTVDNGSTTPIGGPSSIQVRSTAVPFAINGIESDDSGTLTFKDSSNDTVTVTITNGAAVVGTNNTTSTVNLSSLSDGSITSSLSLSDTAGNTFSGSGNTVALDRDSTESLSISVDNGSTTPIGGPSSTLVKSTAVPFTVGGLDTDDSGTLTFSDGTHSVAVMISNGAVIAGTNNTASTVNLSSLSDGVIISSLSITDAAGNTFSSSDNSVTLDQDTGEQTALKLTVIEH